METSTAESTMTLPLLIALPADVPEKVAEDDQSTWSVTHVRDLGEIPDSWLWVGPTLAVVATWGSEPLHVTSLMCSLSPSAFQINLQK